jgi:hypothetical protein
METLLKGYLARQLMHIVDRASGKDVEHPEPPGPAWNLD